MGEKGFWRFLNIYIYIIKRQSKSLCDENYLITYFINCNKRLIMNDRRLLTTLLAFITYISSFCFFKYFYYKHVWSSTNIYKVFIKKFKLILHNIIYTYDHQHYRTRTQCINTECSICGQVYTLFILINLNKIIILKNKITICWYFFYLWVCDIYIYTHVVTLKINYYIYIFVLLLYFYILFNCF